LRGAFPRSVADAVVTAIGAEAGCDLRDPSTWTEPRIWIQRAFGGSPWTDAITARLDDAVDQLAGGGRWAPFTEMGWWPLLFPGFGDAPGYGDDWHVDGTFQHHLQSPEQAILALFTFSDIEPGGGATLLAEGSHHVAAAALASCGPRGLEPDELSGRVTDRFSAFPIVEACAEAGDVVLAHSLVLHSTSVNRGSRVRVMAQPRVDCYEPKRLIGSPLTPVEIVLSRAGNSV
jgi:Phytanoyl-CoA dioxygenase (PhyH)